MTNPDPNLHFAYQYRDASNYKQHGEAVFSNHTQVPLAEIKTRILACLHDEGFFIAHQVQLEECFFDQPDSQDDHPWHEFDFVEETDLPPCDPEYWSRHEHHRDVSEFLADLETAHRAGWDETCVRSDIAQIFEQQKVDIKQSPLKNKEVSNG
jgi:hypothetical protein